jgi:hypothetical protein
MKIIINYKNPIFDDNSKITGFELFNRYIIENKSKKGGDIFEDLDEIIIQKKSKITNENIETKIKEHKKGLTINISNILINEYMTIYDLKTLIYNIIGISIENQHIEQYIDKDQYKNIEYTFENTTLLLYLDTCLNNLIKYDNNQLYNISLDSNLINNRHLYIIKEFSKIKKLKDLDNINNLEFDIFNLDDFILNKEQLNKQLSQDTENFNNIYYGFIEKYFAYYTVDLFTYYLKSDNKLDLYPNLFIEKSNIINKLNELNKLDNITLQKNDINSTINKLNIKVESYNTEKSIDVQYIFNNLELQKFNNIHKIKCKININDKIVYLEKINVLDTKFNNNLLETDIEFDYLSILITINNKKFRLVDNGITLVIDIYNNLYLTFFPNEEFNLEDYKSLLEIEINKIIVQLNKILKLKITLLNKYNIKILSLDSEVLLDNSKNNITYQHIIKKLQNNEYLEYYKLQEFDEITNKIELKSRYADINTFINENKLNTLSDNYFIFHVDPHLIDRYNKIVYNSKIIIQIRIDDIKISYNNININEYEDIKLFYIKIILSSLTKNNIITKNLSNANKIKILKETDPKLYIINKNNKNVYSRKCQSNKQPIIVQPKDVNSKKNVVKYWNFTKNKPEYYTCDNKKYPYVTFLTGLHPNNYCIPCCRKKSVDDVKIFSSYKSIHSKCLKTFKYVKEDIDNTQVKSRYIINYSCKIVLEHNRMMELPITLKKILNNQYNISTDDDEENTYYIQGVMQNFVNIHNVGLIYILSLILNKNISELISFINQFIISNPSIINNILGGKLLNYVSNVKELVKLINNTFSSNINLQNFISFNLWNEFFIGLSIYFGYKYIIIDEIDIDILNDSKLKLLIDNKIKNTYEYISNNYKYIILVRRIINNITYYYPILKLNYKEYFVNNKQYKITFNSDDIIISQIKNIFKLSIEKIQQNTNISLDLLNNYLLSTNKYKIIKYFLNKNIEIYSILLQINNKNEYIYLNLDKTVLSHISYKEVLKSKLYDFNPIKIQSYNIKYNNILQFINDINNFIFKNNKVHYSDIFYKTYINNINLLNKQFINTNKQFINTNKQFSNTSQLDKYLILNDDEVNNIKMDNQYKYLRIQSFIINDNKIIGIICNNLNLYFTDYLDINNGIKMIENRFNKIIQILKSTNIKKSIIDDIILRDFSLENNNYKYYIPNSLDIPNFTVYKNYFRFYKYNPFIINNLINSKEIIQDTRQLNINKAIYDTNLYNLLILHIVDIFKKIKNIKLRNKLKLIISNFSQNDINLIISSKSNKKLYDIIYSLDKEKDKDKDKDHINTIYHQKIYANLIILLRNIINSNQNQTLSKIKQIFLDKFENTRFEFDNLYLYDVLKLNKAEFLKTINKLLNNTIIFKKPNTNENIIDLTLCNSTQKSYYCDKNKLIINKEVYKQLLDIFYYDITNPFKQQLLLNFTSIHKDINKFNNFINEKIYIYY